MVLRTGGATGHRAAKGPRPLSEGVGRADRHNAVRDRAARVRWPPAADRHAPAHRRSARLRADRRAETKDETGGFEMSTTIDVEDVQTTKGEKLLAVILTIFLLIGGVWTYQKIDDVVRNTTPPDFEYRGTPQEQAAVRRVNTADQRLRAALISVGSATSNLELRREAYRTALDEGRRDPQLRQAYIQAQARLARSQQRVAAARREVAEAQPAAQTAQQHISQVQQGRSDKRELLAFVFRLAFVLAGVAIGYWLLARLRRRGSRYYAIGIALVAYSVLLAFAMAVDYLTDYFEPLELGPLVISLFGIGVTLLA